MVNNSAFKTSGIFCRLVNHGLLFSNSPWFCPILTCGISERAIPIRYILGFYGSFLAIYRGYSVSNAIYFLSIDQGCVLTLFERSIAVKLTYTSFIALSNINRPRTTYDNRFSFSEV